MKPFLFLFGVTIAVIISPLPIPGEARLLREIKQFVGFQPRALQLPGEIVIAPAPSGLLKDRWSPEP